MQDGYLGLEPCPKCQQQHKAVITRRWSGYPGPPDMFEGYLCTHCGFWMEFYGGTKDDLPRIREAWNAGGKPTQHALVIQEGFAAKANEHEP